MAKYRKNKDRANVAASEIDKTVKNFLGEINLESSEIEKLYSTWETLRDDEALPNYPYPATHGKIHIVHVLRNLSNLIPLTKQKKDYSNTMVFEIVFAAMIHDIGMYDLIDKGAYDAGAQASRRNHASHKILKQYAEDIPKFKNLDHLTKERILLIAYAHAGDDSESLAQKDIQLREHIRNHPRDTHVLTGAYALRLADLLDNGPDRLVSHYHQVNWRDQQRHHILKHKYITASIQAEDRAITINPLISDLKQDINSEQDKQDINSGQDKISILDASMEVLALYRSLHDDAERHLEALQTGWHTMSPPMPSLRRLDDTLFGSVFPLVRGVNLFSVQYKAALDDFALQRETNPIFQIDIMGHSQYGRFVSNSEDLNACLQKFLSDENAAETPVNLRVLLLDPEMENQQMEEIFQAQLHSESATRLILPQYDERWRLMDLNEKRGDIWTSITKIREWASNIRTNVRMELRLTRRLMYAAITRFGNHMLVSPYRAGGRFQAALALRLTNQAALFDAYMGEFEELWEHPLQTRIYLLKNPRSNENPIKKRVGRGVKSREQTRHFDYDISLISDEPNIDYLLHVLSGNTDPLPPPEIEIQPSAVCALACEHCIGKYLGRSLPGQTSVGGVASNDNAEFLTWERNDKTFDMNSVLDYETTDSRGHLRRVETVRVSGLSGDPLDEGAHQFTLHLLSKVKDANRKVVLFTNGISLGEQSIRTEIIETLGNNKIQDSIHISLDAVEAKTFELIKRGNEDCFRNLITGIRDTVYEIRRSEKNVQITLGFVVSQINAMEILKDSLKLARTLGADAVRFKPDIRMPRSVSLRTWNEFKEEMKQKSEASDSPPWIALTDIPHCSSIPPLTERCWAQYYCPTVSPNGLLYICDHATGHIGDACLGSLFEKPFHEIWEDAWSTLGKRQANCFLCPPSKNRTNQFISELYSLHQYTTDENMKEWLDEARKHYLESQS